MAGTHSSVIYFHGIGDPQRHVSLSTFLDFFDIYGQGQSFGELGRARKFKYAAELTDDEEVINFVEFRRAVLVKGQPKVIKKIRVYEAYWVPEAGARFGTFHVILWLLLRAFNPIKVITSRWRSYPALRLTHLHSLVERGEKAFDAASLERWYRDFENWESRSAHRAGTFKQFCRFVKERTEEQRFEKLVTLAKLWRRSVVFYNLKLLSYVVIALAICAWITALIALVSWRFYQETSVEGPSSRTALYVAVATAVFLAIILAWRRFKAYIFDVVSWTMDSEKDERFAVRERVVRYAQKLIRHVVNSPDCADCLIISHSLGSSVAAEALLREGQISSIRARRDGLQLHEDSLQKVHTLFTVGSPIDRIFYLFQTDRTFSHRYNRLFEEQRLSISMPPFWDPTRPATAKVVNFWSRFDPISTRLTALRKSVSERRDAIINVEAFPSGVPFPIGAHTSYYSDQRLMRIVYHSVMTGRLPDIEPMPRSRVQRWFGPWVTFSAAFVVLILLSVATITPPTSSLVGPSAILLTSLWLWSAYARQRYQQEHGPFLRR